MEPRPISLTYPAAREVAYFVAGWRARMAGDSESAISRLFADVPRPTLLHAGLGAVGSLLAYSMRLDTVGATGLSAVRAAMRSIDDLMADPVLTDAHRDLLDLVISSSQASTPTARAAFVPAVQRHVRDCDSFHRLLDLGQTIVRRNALLHGVGVGGHLEILERSMFGALARAAV